MYHVDDPLHIVSHVLINLFIFVSSIILIILLCRSCRVDEHHTHDIPVSNHITKGYTNE